MFSLYCHVCSLDGERRKETERLWQWVGQVRERLPERTKIVIGTDANGHVGSHRRQEVDEVGYVEEGGCREGDEYVHIGGQGAEKENYNGTLMREFLEHHDMVAVNTWDSASSGWTWKSSDQKVKHRVDYVLVDRGWMEEGGQAIADYGRHRRLRDAVGRHYYDHVPVGWKCKVQPWEPAVRKDHDRIDITSMSRSCIRSDEKAIG